MSRYLIKLKPLTPFFFGGENTFGEGDANYFAKSNYLPQQTTLLGFLRYEILAQNDLLGSDPIVSNWASLIGSKSFECESGKFTSSFGAISKLSPLFIIEKGISYIHQSMDWAYCKDGESELNACKISNKILSPIHVSFSNDHQTLYTSKSKGFAPGLTTKKGVEYDPKMGLKSLWVNLDGNINRQWEYEVKFDTGKGYENGFFVEKTQIGIHREINKPKSQKGDFYKQMFMSFHEPDTHFAFYVDLDLPSGKELKSRITTMGGERSVFEMTITQADDQKRSFEDIFKDAYATSHPERKSAVILTSDAYCHQDILDKCKFAITDSIPFRNITTKQMKNMDYVALDRTDKSKAKLYKTKELIYLLKRGSILFADDALSIKKSIEDVDSFYNIGYNHCIAL